MILNYIEEVDGFFGPALAILTGVIFVESVMHISFIAARFGPDFTVSHRGQHPRSGRYGPGRFLCRADEREGPFHPFHPFHPFFVSEMFGNRCIFLFDRLQIWPES